MWASRRLGILSEGSSQGSSWNGHTLGRTGGARPRPARIRAQMRVNHQRAAWVEPCDNLGLHPPQVGDRQQGHQALMWTVLITG